MKSGIRNSIESWFSKLKRRIKRFNFSIYKNEFRKMNECTCSIKLTISIFGLAVIILKKTLVLLLKKKNKLSYIRFTLPR